MSGNVETLLSYQQLVKLSQSMLSLAVDGKWNDLIDCEMNYLQTVEQVTKNPPASTLPNGLQSQIRVAIKEILDNESQLKSLLNGRMDELRDLVDSSTNQRNISSSYGKLSSNILYSK